MNFIPGRLTGGQLETPFGTHAVESDRMRRAGEHDLVILGIRPQDFEDASLLSDEKRPAGPDGTKATVDVTEWLGNELYAYVPYEAPAAVTDQLREPSASSTASSCTQLIVALDLRQQHPPGQQGRPLVRHRTGACLRPHHGREPHPRPRPDIWRRRTRRRRCDRATRCIQLRPTTSRLGSTHWEAALGVAESPDVEDVKPCRRLHPRMEGHVVGSAGAEHRSEAAAGSLPTPGPRTGRMRLSTANNLGGERYGQEAEQAGPRPGPCVAPAARPEAGADPPAKMKRKRYEREMRRLHGELVAMQEWVKASGAKICVVFEGRDTAGKGGARSSGSPSG